MIFRPLDIVNPEMDQGFYLFEEVKEMKVAVGWLPWWIEGSPEPVAEGYLKRPEWAPELLRTASGQKWFTTFATHRAGIYQRVPTPISRLVQFTARMQFWSHHTDGTTGGMGLRIGIDPRGGIEPLAGHIEWSDWAGETQGWDGSTWRDLTVTAYTESQYATFFIRSECNHRAKHNDAYLDGVVARIEDTGETPPGAGVTEQRVREIVAEMVGTAFAVAESSLR